MCNVAVKEAGCVFDTANNLEFTVPFAPNPPSCFEEGKWKEERVWMEEGAVQFTVTRHQSLGFGSESVESSADIPSV